MKILSVVAISGLILLTPSWAWASKRVALVIGNAGYTNANPLKNPINDANDVAAALRQLNFTVLLGTDTDYNTMRKLLQDFSREVADADVATLFYAGHGLSVGGENYLLPIDAKLASKTDLDFQALALSLVQRQMEQNATTRLIFLDACRDNPLTRSWTSSSRSAAGKGLSTPTGKTKGTYIAFATEPGSVAFDGDGKRNSPFSTAFLKHVTKPGLELASLMKRVRRDVTIATKDRQVPWSNSGLIGDFYFNPAKIESAPKHDSAELTVWNEVKDSRDADLLNHFVDRFPKGVFTGLAKVKLQQLAVLKRPPAKTKSRVDVVVEDSEVTNRSIATCHRLAAYPGDSNRIGSGVKFSKLKKDASSAVLACGQAVKATPGDSILQFQLGRALEAAERYGEAAQPYRKAAEQNHASAQNNLGVLYKNGNLGKKNYPEAVRWFRKAAEQGKARAQFNLAYSLDVGRGVKLDDAEAAVWYRRAAAQNHANAQNNLGIMYLNGELGEKDHAEAVRWFRKSAALGNKRAQYSLGYALEKGRGVGKDQAEAVRWYRKSAKKGYAKAQFRLALSFGKGRGVEKDYAEAARWYQKAATQNHVTAQNNLGVAYQLGRGVSKNSVKAAQLYRKSADQGSAYALKNLGNLYEWGNGVPKNSKKAAQLVFAAVKKEPQLVIRYLKKDSSHSNKFRIEMQRLLKRANVYSGPLDGAIGAGTLTAIKKYAAR